MSTFQYIYKANPGPKAGSPYYNGFKLQNCAITGNTYQYSIIWSQGWTGVAPSNLANHVVLSSTTIQNNIVEGAIRGQITPVEYASLLAVYFTKLEILDSTITNNANGRGNADINLFSSQLSFERSTLSNPKITVDLSSCTDVQLYTATGTSSATQKLTKGGCYEIPGSSGLSPAPYSASGVGGVFCFPGTAQVTVQDKGVIAMNALALGDAVLTDQNTYERVYSFGHADAKLWSDDYVQLRTAASGNTVELSRDHMVFVEGGRALPAAHIKVGDALVLASGSVDTVESVRRVARQGAFAPFTPSGTIVVNGVKASSFVAFQESEVLQFGGFSTGLTYQWIGQTFEFPHRVWCTYVSDCMEEQYVNGVSTWVALPHRMTLWFVDQGVMMQMLLSLPILMVFGLLGMIHTMASYPMTLLVGVLFAMSTHRLRIKAIKR